MTAADQLEKLQLEKLRRLLRAILPTNRFYAARLTSADLRSLSEFTSNVPFTCKAELAEDQAKNPPYGSNLTYPLERYCRFHQTSGTTGRPLRWLDTPESWDWMIGCWTRVYQSAEVTPEDRVFF